MLKYSDKNVENIAQLAFENLYANYTDIMIKLDEKGLEKCKQDVRYHTSFLVQALTLNSPSLFIDYVKWVKELFSSIGISIDGFIKSLESIEEAIKILFGEQDKSLAKEFIDIAVQELKDTNNIMTNLNDNPLKEYKNMYLNFLLESKRMEAMDLISRLVKQGYSIRDIYLYIFRDSLYEVGLLWQTGRVTVAQEHYFTASTQMIMTQLYPYIFNERKNGKIIIGACVSGELHEIGIRMVCDLLEMDGYDTHYLGANMPTHDIIEYAYKKSANAILLSVTLTTHLNTLKSMIKEIKKDERMKDVKVIVGGRPFLIDENLYKMVGADYYSVDVDDIKIHLMG